MKWSILSTAALSVLVVNLHAGQSSTSTSQPGTSAHSTKILTGCLRVGTAPDTYKLTDATPKVDPKDLAGPPVGTSGEKAEYDLAADTSLEHSGPPVDLKTHVGQRVELTTRPADTTVAPAANSSGTPTATEAKPAERKPARVTVAALKSLSPSCSPR